MFTPQFKWQVEFGQSVLSFEVIEFHTSTPPLDEPNQLGFNYVARMIPVVSCQV